MPRPWKRKLIKEGGKLTSLKQLIEFGDSYALVIPKKWLHYFAIHEKDGSYWVKIQYDGSNEIIIGGKK